MSNDDLLRLLTEAHVAADDLDAVVKDMRRRARKRELGPKLHRKHARDAYKKLIALLDHLIRGVRGGPLPPPEGDRGPTAH